MSETNTNSSPQLAEIITQLDSATRQASAVVEGLSAAQLKEQVTLGSWSVSECIVHLNMTSEEYLPILNEALERARHEKTSSTTKLKMDIIGRLLKWSLEPPYKMKVKTTAQFQPHSEPLEEILPKFLRLQEELKAKIQSADRLAIDRVKIKSPFNNRVKYNLFSAFNVLVAHQRRHLWQAEQVKQRLLNQ